MVSLSSRQTAMQHLLMGVGLSTLCLLTSPLRANAAEEVVLRYSALERSISVDELTALAETGEVSPELESYLKTAGQKPERLRNLLNRTATVNVVPLDRVLNSPLGEPLLDRMGDIVHTSSDRANREALRSALVLSASDDSKISLLEVIQNYPTPEVYVNGNQLVAAYRQISNFSEHLTDILEGIGLPSL